MGRVVVVVPTIRPESHAQFVKAWGPLFEKHKVTLVTVWDGENPDVRVETFDGDDDPNDFRVERAASEWSGLWDRNRDYRNTYGNQQVYRDLFCRRTDACRNLGFVVAARMLTSPDDVVVTMDDDVAPLITDTGKHDGYDFNGHLVDPIQAHLDVLQKRVPVSWMNTAHDTDLYLRGVPYGVRDEAPVMMSHGVWVGTPDFDGETQLKLEGWGELVDPDPFMEPCGHPKPTTGVPYSLPYYVGPVPKAVLMPICGMNLAFKRDMLPYVYFAPQGPDSGVEGLNRFADIWMGIHALRAMWERGWACYTGASTVLHTRASDARKNFEQEKLGREWNERIDTEWSDGIEVVVRAAGDKITDPFYRYMALYADRRKRYAALVTGIMGGGT